MPQAAKISWIALLSTVVAVPVVVGTVPFGPQFMLSPFASPAVLVLGAGGGVAVIAWAIALMRGEIAARSHRLLLALAVFAALLVVSTAFSLDPLYSLFGDGDDLNGLAVYALAALLVPVVLSHCTNRKAIETLTTAVIVPGVVVAGIALLQQLFGVDVFGEVPAEQRASLMWMIHQGASTLGNPDYTAGYLVVPTVLAVSRATRANLKSWRDIAQGLLPALLMGSALVLTLTRGAWLALAAGIAVALAVPVVRQGKVPSQVRNVAIAIAAALAVVLLWSASEITRRISELLGGGLAGFAGRSIVWSEALAIVRTHPLSGAGLAAFRLGWYPIRQIAGLIVGAGAVATDAHSYPLMLAAIAGIPAALVAVVTWVGVLWTSGRIVWNRAAKASGDYTGWWAAAFALGVALLTGVATTPVLLLVFLCAAVLLVPLAHEVRLSATARTSVSLAALVLAAVSLVACVWQGQVHFAARSALLRSPDALSSVAASAQWNGTIGLLAARFESDAVIQQSAALGEAASSQALDAAFQPLAERHPRDYEVFHWWATQSFIAGDVLKSPALLEHGLSVSARGLELYPNSLSLRTNRARTLLDLERPDEARAELAGYTGADPNYPQTQQVWALIEAAQAEQGK